MKIDYQGFVVEIRTGGSPWRRNSYYYAVRADAERHAVRQRLFGREARVVETDRAPPMFGLSRLYGPRRAASVDVVNRGAEYGVLQ
jgi:hypothetical protein